VNQPGYFTVLAITDAMGVSIADLAELACHTSSRQNASAATATQRHATHARQLELAGARGNAAAILNMPSMSFRYPELSSAACTSWSCRALREWLEFGKFAWSQVAQLGA
jgi:hypothetical protein